MRGSKEGRKSLLTCGSRDGVLPVIWGEESQCFPTKVLPGLDHESTLLVPHDLK